MTTKKVTSPFKHDRTETLLKELAAKYILTESSGKSLITITHCALSRKFDRATFFVSIFPVTEEEKAIDFLKRKRSEVREYIQDNSKIGRIPFVEFEFDLGEKNRQRVDELLSADKNEQSTS
jgi:ribosome-binding factor A